jgi:hypothetical protein
MSRERWCRHYACTKELLDRFHFVFAGAEGALDSNERLADLCAELEKRNGEVLQHAMTNVWRDVHRALTDDDCDQYLDLTVGEYPLRLCISGGEGLNPTWDGCEDLVILVRAEQVPELCRALEAIDKAWFRRKLRALDGQVLFSNDGEESDEVLTPAWKVFRSLRAFYLEAEKAGLPVVCVLEM